MNAPQPVLRLAGVEAVSPDDPAAPTASPAGLPGAAAIPEGESGALRAAKLAALAEFAAGAGHEINNPLAVILGRVEMLVRRLRDGGQRPLAEAELERQLLIIAGQAHRIRDMIGDLMLFARPPAPDRREFDPRPVVARVVERLAAAKPSASIAVFDVDCREPISADRMQFEVVVSELIRNALASNPTGPVQVRLNTLAGQPPGLRLQVLDRGPGLSETDREHLFDPFYSGRPAGRGLGFGLCKCWRIVQLHGGRIDVSAALDGGGGVQAVVDWPG